MRRGARWWRIYRLEYEPLSFGRIGRYRFDDPLREYGVLYVARDVLCAFIETLGHVTGRNVISRVDLRARGLVRIEVTRTLRLVDLTGAGLQHIGADARLTTGSWTVAQRWSRVFWEHPNQPHGILYRSRHDASRVCAALFDRSAGALQADRLGSLIEPEVEALYARAFAVYHYDLLD